MWACPSNMSLGQPGHLYIFCDAELFISLTNHSEPLLNSRLGMFKLLIGVCACLSLEFRLFLLAISHHQEFCTQKLYAASQLPYLDFAYPLAQVRLLTGS